MSQGFDAVIGCRSEAGRLSIIARHDRRHCACSGSSDRGI
jgi:hypothetical protein